MPIANKHDCLSTQTVIKMPRLMLPGVQVTTGPGFFLRSSHLSDSEDASYSFTTVVTMKGQFTFL